ncbi:MAG: sulfotransferase [Acidimicrobiia bacterium]|nr:sulfotransferase [Acidimicrobiia bacterium]
MKPILVTGSNRSGTTWVGAALGQSGEVEYLHEPFNSSIWPRSLARSPGGHYLYVCEENKQEWQPSVERLLRYRFPVRSQVPEVRSPRDAAKLARDWARSGVRKARHRRPLLKDPIALFASEWLAQRFDMDVVVMVRHPAAFASSIKRLRWAFDFQFWLDQPLLMRDHLEPLRSELERMVSTSPDHVEQAIVLWNAFYSVVDRLRARHPDWHVLNYEDLAEAPVDGFARLYPALGLRFDDEVARRVGAFSAEGNVKEVAASDKGTVRRDSRAAKWTWRRRLTPEEIERVRAGTRSVASRFYDASAWEPPTGDTASSSGASVASQP